MSGSIQDSLDSFERDIKRNSLFLQIERKIKNPAGVRSRARSETLLSAYVSLTCGRFESFLQEVFFNAADDIKTRIVKSNDHRITRWEKFHWTNMNSFIHWAVSSGRRLSKADLELKIQSYSAAISAGEIFPESFQYTNANPKSDTVIEMFSRFGVEAPFVKISTKYLDSRGRTFNQNLLKTMLDNFVSRRHEAAHHGRIPNMTRADAQDDEVFISALARAITLVLGDHLAVIV